MGTFFLFILIIFFVIIILGLSFLRGIVKMFIGRPFDNSSRKNSNSTYNSYSNSDKNTSHQSNDHKKVFRRDEGEYIDFEEMKV